MDNVKQKYSYVNGIIILKTLSKTNKNIEINLGYLKESDTLCIVRKIATDKEQLYTKVYKEYEILSKLDHINILKLNKEKYTFKTSKNGYFVEEYLNLCNLHFFTREYKFIYKKPLSETIIQHILKQLIDGVSYLHEKRIIHRNLSMKSVMLNIKNLDNFCKDNDISYTFSQELIYYNKIEELISLYINKLFSKDLVSFEKDFLEYVEVKIIDLGIAKEINMDFATRTILLSDKNAPETKNGEYSFPSDFWSLGILTFELLFGTEYNVSKHKDNDIELPEKLNCSSKIIQFINLLLEKNTEKRRENISIINKHPFLTSNIKEENKVLIEKRNLDYKSYDKDNLFIQNHFNCPSIGSLDYESYDESESKPNSIQKIGEYIHLNENYFDFIYSEKISKVVNYSESNYSFSEIFVNKNMMK